MRASMAMRQAVMDARPVLLEPIMDVEVVVPERNMGEVISDLNGKRGRIAGMEPSGDHMEKVKAQVVRAVRRPMRKRHGSPPGEQRIAEAHPVAFALEEPPLEGRRRVARAGCAC